MKKNHLLFYLWLSVAVIIITMVWLARAALIPFFIGGILAYILKPLVNRTATLIQKSGIASPQLKRMIAIIFVYGFLGITTLMTLLIIGDGVSKQVVQFTDDLPELTEKARIQFIDLLNQYRNQVPAETQVQIDSYLADFSLTLSDNIAQFTKNFISYLTNTIAILFGFLLTPFWMFYVMRDDTFNKNNILNIVPNHMRKDIKSVIDIFEKIIGNYFRGQFILAIVVGIVTGITLTIMNVPMSFALGIIAGITELIPVIGPWIALIPALLIVLSFDSGLILPVILIYVSIQLIENLILVPKVHSDTIDVQPAITLVLLIICGYLFGFFGLLFALPGYAFLRETLLYISHRLSE